MTTQIVTDVTEQKRPNDAREAGIPWKKRGPYDERLTHETIRNFTRRFP